MDGAEGSFEAILPTRAVNERVAAARLGVSVDMLRKDRRSGKLGIPYVKFAQGRRGLVRYDLAVLGAWIASKTQRALPRPVVEVQAPAAPVMPALPKIPLEELSEEPPIERIDPPPPRRAPPRTPWEALAERYAEEPEDDPFAPGRVGPRRPGRYWTGA
jgi:hypothetical protein